MALPDAVYSELEALVERYNEEQTKPLNTLNVQELLRLITKAHLYELRGPSKIQELRLKGFSTVKFVMGQCPNCKLRFDKQDFPVLVEAIESDGLECHVCGHRSFKGKLG